jgi:hypothetical protein
VLPLPDLLVYVRSPLDTLVKRTLHRTDPPREVRSKGRAAAEAHIRGAVTLFDRLVETDSLRGRVLAVENGERTPQEYDALVEHIAHAILSRAPANHRAAVREQLLPEPS